MIEYFQQFDINVLYVAALWCSIYFDLLSCVRESYIATMTEEMNNQLEN